MTIFKKTLLASAVIVTFTVSPYAISDENKEGLQKDTETLNFKTSNTVVTQQMIDDADDLVSMRDDFRNAEDLENKENSAIQAKIEKYKSKRELMTLEFLIDNVPPEILVAGEKEVRSFVQKNFIDSKVAVAEGEDKIWSSTDNALSKPVKYQQWNQNIVQIDAQPTTISETEDKTEIEGEDALLELGISKEELASLFGEPSDAKKDVPESKPVNIQPTPMENVLINKIDIKRAVVMGNLSFVNVDIVFDITQGEQRRSVEQSFNEINPGFIFKVKGARFELVSIDERSVVFENLDTQTTYREIIK